MYSRSSRSSEVMVTLFRGHVRRARQTGDDRRVASLSEAATGWPTSTHAPCSTVGLVALGQVVLVTIRLARDDLDDAAVFGALQLDDAVELGQDGLALGHACLEQLFDARQARGDVDTRDAARVERTHGQLRAWLADRLRRHDADRVAHLRPCGGYPCASRSTTGRCHGAPRRSAASAGTSAAPRAPRRSGRASARR